MKFLDLINETQKNTKFSDLIIEDFQGMKFTDLVYDILVEDVKNKKLYELGVCGAPAGPPPDRTQIGVSVYREPPYPHAGAPFRIMRCDFTMWNACHARIVPVWHRAQAHAR